MSVLEQVRGRILDTDSHEYTPAGLWPQVFGASTTPVADFILQTHDPDLRLSLGTHVALDEAPIEDATSSWQAGAFAPGAFDMTRRPKVMDVFGVDQAFVFPSGPGAIGMLAICSDLETLQRTFGIKLDALGGFEIDDDLLKLLGKELIATYNRWCVETAKISQRLRPVPVLDPRDLPAAIQEAEHLIAHGIRAVFIPQGIPPGGMSPGHPGVDPLWRVLASNHIPVIFHGGGDFGLLSSPHWREYSPDVSNAMGQLNEIPLDPYTISSMCLGAQNALTAMIYGGVFERFPELRIGVIECSAHWVGPMAENLENVGQQFRRALKHLSLTPAEYFQRNVRVSPFWWEPIDRYIERFGLEDVYVYGSDYPHFEGGYDPGNIFASKLERLGPTIVEKFFVKNAQLLMPQ